MERGNKRRKIDGERRWEKKEKTRMGGHRGIRWGEGDSVDLLQPTYICHRANLLKAMTSQVNGFCHLRPTIDNLHHHTGHVSWPGCHVELPPLCE